MALRATLDAETGALLVHHGDWTVRIAADQRPDFLPPAWIHPERQPRRNPHSRPAALTLHPGPDPPAARAA